MTFITPIRVDSINRLENLLMSLYSILDYFDTRFLLLESTSYPNYIIPELIKIDSVKIFIS